MAQSVKLSNGDYLDTSGIYDTSLGMTQKEVNALDKFEILYRTSDAARSYTFKPSRSIFWIVCRYGILHYDGSALSQLASNPSTATFDMVANSDGTYTFSRTDGVNVIYYGITVFA